MAASVALAVSAVEKILILDYGSQFTLLIARKFREMGVFCEILPCEADEAAVRAAGAAGVVLSGGPRSALEAGAPAVNAAVPALGVPVLAVCYGMQALMLAGGGRVAAGSRREYGAARVRLTAVGARCPLFAGVAEEGADWRVWMSHGDWVAAPAAGFAVAAVSGGGEEAVTAAVADETRRWYGVQFHPEVAHTAAGGRVLRNFALDICGVRDDWTMPNFVPRAVAAVRAQVGDEGRVVLGLSGGVDSAVTAALVHRAVGGRLICVLVDNGLMRAGEAAEVREVFERQFGMRLVVVDAAARFLAALSGVTAPEEKRRRIGRVFVEVFEEEAVRAGAGGEVGFLAQGTIYPDVVESAGGGEGGGGKAVIKSHHNVGGLPDRLRLRLVEPLRALFKDEVRALGEALGLPRALMRRHPFPGPGLAVRVLGEVTPERVETARRADAIFLAELRAAGMYEEVAQAFVVLLAARSVGVMGDARTYEEAAVLRAVTTADFMTADWARLDGELLARVSGRIINEVPGINRVVYDVSSKPPATVEWE